MAERNFDEEAKARKGHTFTLGGKKFRTAESFSSAWILRRRLSKDDIDPENVKVETVLDYTVDFLKSIIIPEDRKVFEEMLVSEDVMIEAKDIVAVSKWLIEVITETPTKPPLPSGLGDGGTSNGSKATSSKRGKTGKR